MDNNWLSLKQAGKLTGKSITSLRMLIKRGKINQAKKENVNGRQLWFIHKNELSGFDKKVNDQAAGDQLQENTSLDDQQSSDQAHDQGGSASCVTLPVEIYLQKQEERDRLIQGITMYRYKFEELDRHIKLLPAPAEVIIDRLEAQNQNLVQKNKEIEKLKSFISNLKEEKAKLLKELENSRNQDTSENSRLQKITELEEENRLLFFQIETQDKQLREKEDKIKSQVKKLKRFDDDKKELETLMRNQVLEKEKLENQVEIFARENEQLKQEKETLKKLLKDIQTPWWQRLFISDKNDFTRQA